MVRVACIQMRSGLERAKNVSDALALIARAAEGGAQIILTPEMTNVVDANAKRLLADLPDEAGLDEVAAFSAAAKAHRIWLIIGSLAVKVEESRAANRTFVFAPDGSCVARYDKAHMFDVDLPDGERWRESAVYRPGTQAVLVRTPLAAIGLGICYDVRFPAHFQALARAGAQILTVPAAFTAQTGAAHWHTLLRARAIENGAFVMAAGQGGHHEDGRDTYGHSLVYGPWGDLIAEQPNDETGVVFAELDLEKGAQARQRIPNLSLETNCEMTIIDL